MYLCNDINDIFGSLCVSLIVLLHAVTWIFNNITATIAVIHLVIKYASDPPPIFRVFLND